MMTVPSRTVPTPPSGEIFQRLIVVHSGPGTSAAVKTSEAAVFTIEGHIFFGPRAHAPLTPYEPRSVPNNVFDTWNPTNTHHIKDPGARFGNSAGKKQRQVLAREKAAKGTSSKWDGP
jgi:hypothetical protein